MMFYSIALPVFDDYSITLPVFDDAGLEYPVARYWLTQLLSPARTD